MVDAMRALKRGPNEVIVFIVGGENWLIVLRLRVKDGGASEVTAFVVGGDDCFRVEV